MVKQIEEDRRACIVNEIFAINVTRDNWEETRIIKQGIVLVDSRGLPRHPFG